MTIEHLENRGFVEELSETRIPPAPWLGLRFRYRRGGIILKGEVNKNDLLDVELSVAGVTVTSEHATAKVTRTYRPEGIFIHQVPYWVDDTLEAMGFQETNQGKS
jgi:hypothetical protein